MLSKYLNKITQGDCLKLLKEIPINESSNFFGIAKDKNVIVIQVEALQSFTLFKSINGKEITPNLNKLTKESIHFPNFYHQIGQGNTSDAEFIVNSSSF